MLQALHLAMPEFFDLVPANGLDFPAPSRCFRFRGHSWPVQSVEPRRIFGDHDVGLDRTARYIRPWPGGPGAGRNKPQMPLNWTVVEPPVVRSYNVTVPSTMRRGCRAPPDETGS